MSGILRIAWDMDARDDRRYENGNHKRDEQLYAD